MKPGEVLEICGIGVFRESLSLNSKGVQSSRSPGCLFGERDDVGSQTRITERHLYSVIWILPTYVFEDILRRFTSFSKPPTSYVPSVTLLVYRYVLGLFPPIRTRLSVRPPDLFSEGTLPPDGLREIFTVHLVGSVSLTTRTVYSDRNFTDPVSKSFIRTKGPENS